MQMSARYFSDNADGAIELVSIQPMRNAKVAELFPGVRAIRYDGLDRIVGRTADGRILPATRQIYYKKQPSMHVCNAKCMGGKVNGSCECQCGGKNHGRSSFGAAYRAA